MMKWLLITGCLFLLHIHPEASPMQHSAGRHPQSYILVVDTLVQTYRVYVAFEMNCIPDLTQPGLVDYSYLTDLKNSKIAVTLPPADTQAIISIFPESDKYTATKAYEINNLDAHIRLMRATEGFFDSHSFDLVIKTSE